MLASQKQWRPASTQQRMRQYWLSAAIMVASAAVALLNQQSHTCCWMQAGLPVLLGGKLQQQRPNRPAAGRQEEPRKA